MMMKQEMSEQESLTPSFWITKRVTGSGDRTPTFFIPTEWDFKKGDRVDLEIWKTYQPDFPPVRTTTCLSTVGKSPLIYISSRWGIRRDEMITIRLRSHVNVNPRRDDKEEIEGVHR